MGGWPAADLLQAADSLSFLETMVGQVLEWPRAAAVARFEDAVARMSIGREHALPLRQAADTLLNARLLGNGRTYRLAPDTGVHIDGTEIPPLWRRGVLYEIAAPVDAAALVESERATGVAAGLGDVALFHTAGPDLSAARLLAERGVVALGTDAQPTAALPGIYTMQSLLLEELTATGTREFLFVALPTGSMIAPVAIT